MATRLILVGGFLGAGKTTLLLQAARTLAGRGLRAAIVTNDQGHALVDTALAAAHALPVEEIGGGCFCCRFPDLVAAVARLRAAVAPDVILAEPVGSCTDLVATVIRPLRAFGAGDVTVAPLTVLLDPLRDLRGFDDTVGYLYAQQLAEAEIIALGKLDLLAPEEARAQLAGLRRSNPGAQVVALSGRGGEGVAAWLDRCLAGESGARRALDLDYERYAAAEASLGWLNAAGELRGARPFALDGWAASALYALDRVFAERGAPVAHIKIHLETPGATLKASLTHSGAPISWDLLPLNTRAERADVRLNVRVAGEPALLEGAVRRLAAETPPWIALDITQLECFSPPPPQPAYRLGGAVD
ncbi:MAG TPA: GTP-binding protein [Roseiflexaceae bacterium]|nr:GTP-binding protein [Roseiflexaceae bacterium]